MRFFWVLMLLITVTIPGCYHQEGIHKKLEKELALELLAVGLARESHSGRYKLITTRELYQRLKSGGWSLVDVRTGSSFRRGHIPGSTNFAFPKGVVMSGDWNAQLMEGRSKMDFIEFLGADRNRMLIFTCGRTSCERGHNAAMWAVRLGYTNVFRHPGGLDAWMGAGYGIAQ